MPTDFDSPWKEVLDELFEGFIGLLFPRVHAAVDWSRDHVPLDTELQQIIRGRVAVLSTQSPTKPN